MSGAKPRGPGRPPLSKTSRILNAVRGGAQDARSIARRARVPLEYVHPTLYRLRKDGRIKGYSGKMRAKSD